MNQVVIKLNDKLICPNHLYYLKQEKTDGIIYSK